MLIQNSGYDVPNRPVIKGTLHSYFSSEDDACMDSMDFQDRVFLFDRGYPSFWLLYLLIQKDVKFVMRVSQSGNNTVQQFMESSEKELITQWYPDYHSGKKLKGKNTLTNCKRAL